MSEANEVLVFKLKICQYHAWPYCGHIFWFDSVDLSDPDSAIVLQVGI